MVKMAMIVTLKKPPIKLTGDFGLWPLSPVRACQVDIGKFLVIRQRNQSRFP